MSRNPDPFSVGLQALFPPGIVVAESRESGDPGQLLPAEADCLGRAVPKRIREFAAGRLCARRALAELGIHGFALRAAPDRSPIWPAGIVGSISHTSGLCAAAVAERRSFLSLGLDCEVSTAVSADIWPAICLESEMNWIRSLSLSERALGAAMIFSAKEAFYKCQYPMAGEWLDFHDLHVVPMAWGEPRAAFTVSATRRIAFDAYAALPILGRYILQQGFIATGVALPAGAGSGAR